MRVCVDVFIACMLVGNNLALVLCGIESGQLIIQLSQAHEYTILEDSIVLEVKNGPYFGPEKDRTRIEKI